MARNTYFTHGRRSERDLYESLIVEAIGITGMDVYYIPREILALDKILNEDIISQFTESFKIEMYIESVEGFEGVGDSFSKYGLEIRDQCTFVVSTRRWKVAVDRFSNLIRPREGDLIYLGLTESLFEVKFVEDKKPFMQLGGGMVYKLNCELYEYNSAKIKTGVAEVDVVRQQESHQYMVDVEFADPKKRFRVNDTVLITLPTGLTCTTDIISANGLRLGLGPLTFSDGVFHRIVTGSTIALGDVEAEITEVYDITNAPDSVNFKNDFSAQNSAFEQEGNSLIDFSESNPFGEP